MRRDYELAKKLGNKALKAAKKNNTTPYLPVLDLSDVNTTNSREIRAGLMELPVNRIKGTKEVSRHNAFASNFMPLHGIDSEFAYKWSDLIDSVVANGGIRDAIKVYEYMHEYYVQEGNKRVSVSKYYKIDFILADVIRIIPAKDETNEEIMAYYEFLDFYNVTKNYYITLNKPGAYKKLAELLNQNLTDEWPEDLLIDLKAAYFQFIKTFKKIVKTEDEYLISNAFVTYISLYSLDSLFETDKQIKHRIEESKNILMGIDENSDNNSVKSGKFRNFFVNLHNSVASVPSMLENTTNSSI